MSRNKKYRDLMSVVGMLHQELREDYPEYSITCCQDDDGDYSIAVMIEDGDRVSPDKLQSHIEGYIQSMDWLYVEYGTVTVRYEEQYETVWIELN